MNCVAYEIDEVEGYIECIERFREYFNSNISVFNSRFKTDFEKEYTCEWTKE